MPRDDEQYRWRETYFVWFRSSRRPSLEKVAETVRRLDGKYELSNPASDAAGLIESLTITSIDDHSALEVDYAVGEDVLLEANRTADELKPGDGDPEQLRRLPHCDARFEIMHFERFFEGETEEESDDMFDPTALVIVIEALTRLTDGVAIDPASGMIL
jgi:hypothetical protein